MIGKKDAIDGAYLLRDALEHMLPKERRALGRVPVVRQVCQLLTAPARGRARKSRRGRR
ncbi:MAG TPA: hypothetical protein VFF73_17790 [Planctomycetota bacterium]|nr:hypothetical protein [Planctomycetota bacterium]